MQLYSPVDLTGTVNMIEKLVLGRTETRDFPIISPMRRQPLRQGRLHRGEWKQLLPT